MLDHRTNSPLNYNKQQQQQQECIPFNHADDKSQIRGILRNRRQPNAADCRRHDLNIDSLALDKEKSINRNILNDNSNISNIITNEQSNQMSQSGYKKGLSERYREELGGVEK